jgi:hypothetical protein
MKLDFCVSHNYTQRDLLLLHPPSLLLLLLHHHDSVEIPPKHVTNKNKTKHIMKISHISFI